MEQRNYLTCDELKMSSLEALYKGSAEALKTLEYNIIISSYNLNISYFLYNQ